MLHALNSVRQQGCESGASPVALLLENPALSRAALLLANSCSLDDALGAVAYRALRAAQINVRGAPGEAALARQTLDKSCHAVMHPELTEAGFHQRGKLTWLVVAARCQQAVLAHALPLLARGQSVSQVAAASAYASDSAFFTMFKAAMGVAEAFSE